jgi:hypothetical protein
MSDNEDVELLGAGDLPEEDIFHEEPGHVDKTCRSVFLSPYPVVVVFLALSLGGLVMAGLVLDEVFPAESLWVVWGILGLAQVPFPPFSLFFFFFFFSPSFSPSSFLPGVGALVYRGAVDLSGQGGRMSRLAGFVLGEGVLERFHLRAHYGLGNACIWSSFDGKWSPSDALGLIYRRSLVKKRIW